MTDIFLKLVNMSISASWIVIALVIFRFAIKKAPRYISCLFWGIVGLRLVFPFSLKSILSLIPTSTASYDVTFTEEAVNAIPPVINQAVNPIIMPDTNITVAVPETNVMDTWLLVAAVIWAVVAVLMILYFTVNYIRIKHILKLSEQYSENIKLCEFINTPFVLGIIKPEICLPKDIEEEYIEYVIAHEKAHIKRRDNIWKPLAFVILSVYWFNPLMWVSFILFSKDMEFACDERVIKERGVLYKKPYSMALMNCSSIEEGKIINLALGEISVKERIKKIIDYKKPPFYVTIIAVIVVVCMCVGFLTDPVDKKKTDKKPTNAETVTSQTEDTTDTSSEPTESIVSTPTESKPTFSSKEETVSSTPTHNNKELTPEEQKKLIEEWLNTPAPEDEKVHFNSIGYDEQVYGGLEIYLTREATKQNYDKVYTLEDFAEIQGGFLTDDSLSIIELIKEGKMHKNLDFATFRRKFFIQLEDNQKLEELIDVIRNLEEREDIYKVIPLVLTYAD